MPRAATLRIFLADGSPEGLRLVEKSNWTGHALVCPRSRFSTARDRKEFNRPGVYVLTGLTPDSGLPRVYIGEGDPVRPRLDSHQRDKDFWTTLTLFTSGTENLNKAHIQFLESRLIELARAAKRADLDNQNSPQLPNLSEADQAEMETFLEEMLLIYPVLGLTAFESVKPQQPASTKLWIRAKGVTASGFDTAAGFIVTRGSQAVIDWTPSAHEYAKEHRDSLLQRGVLAPNGDHYVFTQDYTFDSPSGASQVIQGRTSNGRIDWKDEHGNTLKDLQQRPTHN
jgi:hypothetical protein